jgi:hypothetical protein
MVRNKGTEWDHVTIVAKKKHNDKIECKYCQLQFDGNATRIREHFVHKNPAIGVRKCTAAPEEIEDVVASMLCRNRLSPKRADKLVWLYSNLRLIKRMQALDQGQQAQAWMVEEEEEEEGEGRQMSK